MTADTAILRVALIFVTMTDCNYTFYTHLVKQQWTVGKILFVHLTSLSEMLSRRSHQLLQLFFLPPIHSIYQMWSYSDQKFPCSHNCKVESFYLKINWNKSYPDLRMMDCIGPFFTIYVGTLGKHSLSEFAKPKALRILNLKSFFFNVTQHCCYNV